MPPMFRKAVPGLDVRADAAQKTAIQRKSESIFRGQNGRCHPRPRWQLRRFGQPLSW